MKTFLTVLLLVSFLQTTIIPVNLSLIILILRAYLITEKENLYLGFAFGLLISFLDNTPLGLYSIVYLILIESIYLIKKAPITGNFLIVFPITLFTSTAFILITSLLFNQPPRFLPEVIIEALLSIPLFLLLRFWEERFVVKHEIKLKV